MTRILMAAALAVSITAVSLPAQSGNRCTDAKKAAARQKQQLTRATAKLEDAKKQLRKCVRLPAAKRKKLQNCQPQRLAARIHKEAVSATRKQANMARKRERSVCAPPSQSDIQSVNHLLAGTEGRVDAAKKRADQLEALGPAGKKEKYSTKKLRAGLLRGLRADMAGVHAQMAKTKRMLSELAKGNGQDPAAYKRTTERSEKLVKSVMRINHRAKKLQRTHRSH